MKAALVRVLLPCALIWYFWWGYVGGAAAHTLGEVWRSLWLLQTSPAKDIPCLCWCGLRCLTLSTVHRLSCGLDLAMPQSPHLGAGRQQLLKLPNRCDTPVVEHDDLIGSTQRCLAVRDCQDGELRIEN
jgi:hypothetical protein